MRHLTTGRPMRRRFLAVVLGTATVTALAGCGYTAADIPLPGGGGPTDTYRINAVFQDALNLPDKARVKLDGVVVGTVTDIVAKNYTARVTMEISNDTPLPIETTAELRQPTPLGDVHVALHTPDDPLGAKLRAGDTLQLGDTSAAASVEDTLAALSTLVNGGGLGNLSTIVKEMNTALEGHPEEFKGLLTQLNTTLATLNKHTGDIDRVINSAQALTGMAEKHRSTIDAVLRDFAPAMKVVNDQTGKLTHVLRQVDSAAADGDRVLGAVRGDITAMLREAGPVLDGFANLRGTLGPTLRGMVKLGKYVEHITEGEAGAGEASVSGITDIPGFGGELPLGEAFQHGAESFAHNLGELIKRLGGNK